MSEEFLKFLGMQQRSATTNVNQVPDLVASEGDVRRRTAGDRREQLVRDKFKSSDGTPISIDESPLSFYNRGAMSLRRTPEDKKSFLENTMEYGQGNVRLVGDTPIVRTVGEDGNPRDIVVDEDSMTWDDLADMGVAVPEIAGALGVVLSRGRAARGKPLPKGWLGRIGGFLKESALAATGGQAAGGVTDLTTRLRDMPNTFGSSLPEKAEAIDPMEIVKTRLFLGMIDTATGGAGELAGFAVMRGANMARNPFAGSRGQKQSDMIAAAKFLEENVIDAAGNPVKILDNLPLGATTGNRLVSRIEGWSETILARSGPMAKKEEELVKTMRDALNVIVAKDKFPSDYDIGAKIISGFKDVSSKAGKAEKVATWEVSRVGSKEVRDALNLQAGKDSLHLREKAGETVRAAVIKKRNDAKTKHFAPLYDNVSNLVNQLDDPSIVSFGKVNNLIKKIEGHLPTVDVPLNPQGTVEVIKQQTRTGKGKLVRVKDIELESSIDSGVISRKKTTTVRGEKGEVDFVISESAEKLGRDDLGDVSKILGRTTKGKKIHTGYYPDNVRSFLKEFSEMQTLEQAKQARSIINDAIRDSNAMPGVSQKWLRDISSEITDAIDGSVNNLPTPELKNALKQANAVYRNNHAQFRDSRLTKYFKTPDEAGYIGNEGIINDLLAKPDGDAWKSLKEYMTVGMKNAEGVAAPASKDMLDAWESLKLSYMDGILRQASKDGHGDQIAFDTLLKTLQKVNSKAPTILNDVFGVKLGKVQKIANQMQGLEQSGARSGQGYVLDRDLIEGYLRTPTKSKSAINDLLKVQKERDDLLNNQIIGPFLKGDNAALETVPVNKLVDRFIDNGASVGTIKDFIEKVELLPNGSVLKEGMQRRVISKLLTKSRQRKPTGVDDPIGFYSTIPTEMVSGNLLTKEMKNRKDFYEAILDKDQIDVLDAIGKVSLGIETRDEIAGVAGALYVGGLYRQLLTDRKKSLSASYEFGKIYMVSAALASKSLRKWGYRDVMWKEPQSIYRGLLLTPPVIRALYEDSTNKQEFWLKLDSMRKSGGIKPSDEFLQTLE